MTEKDALELLKVKFDIIRDKFEDGRFPKNEDGNAGNTLELLLGIKENNSKMSDYNGFEIKTGNLEKNTRITLFSKAPKPRGTNSKLHKSFATNDQADGYKRLNKTVSFSKRKSDNHWILNTEGDRLYITIEGYDSEIYWEKETIKKIIQSKIKNILYFNHCEQIILNKKRFKYDSPILYQNPSYEKFVALINSGKIVIEFRIGVYKDGKKRGKIHDRGTAFRINQNCISDLFEDKIYLNW